MNHFTRISDPIRPKPGAITPVRAKTIRGILTEVYGKDFKEFPRHTIVIVGPAPKPGDHPDMLASEYVPHLRATWDDELPDDVVVAEMPVVTGILEIILIALVVAAVVAAVVIAATLKKPTIPSGNSDSAGTVHNLAGQRNKNKLGSPIEVAYGRCRLWPSYAAPSYTVYTDNNQYLYLLLCLGQGEFDIESLKIENTEISAYPEVEYAVIPPNGTIPGWLWTNVHTVREVNNVELLAPNDADYPGGRIDNSVTVPDDLPGAAGWIGPYTVSPQKVNTANVALDITFPNGLYIQDTESGTLYPNSATMQAEYRLTSAIPGGAESGWAVLGTFEYTSVLVTGQPLNTPLRFTLNYALPAEGEYQVRVRRATRKQESATAQSQMNWEGMRSYIVPNQTTFGNVTLLAVKVRATNSLNGDVSDRINVTATRKLPTYDAETGLWDDDTLVATRSIVMAYCDVLRNAVYGCGIADEFLDMAALLAIEAHHTSIDYAFDFVFDQKRSAWEALGIIAKSGRCLPTLNGSRVSLVLDQMTEMPLHIFTPDNILRGSFQWQLKLANYQEYDGLRVLYTDENTFNEESLLCCAPDEEGSNPDTVTLDGMTKREQAWHEGLYLRYVTRYMRQNLVFSTGLEGYIPTLGDMIGVSFDVPSWGQSGKVDDAVDMATYTLVTLSNILDFSVVPDGDPLSISFRTGSSGEPTTPYSVIKHEDDDEGQYRVTPVIDPVEFNLDGDKENTIYAAGAPNEQFVLAKITAVVPQEEDSVQITAAVFDEKIFDGDLIPPPEPEYPVPPEGIITIEITGESENSTDGSGSDLRPGITTLMRIVYSADDTSICGGGFGGFGGSPPAKDYWGVNTSVLTPDDATTTTPHQWTTINTINETGLRTALGIESALFTPARFRVQLGYWQYGNMSAPVTQTAHVKVTHSDGRTHEFDVSDIPPNCRDEGTNANPWLDAQFVEISVPPTGAGLISHNVPVTTPPIYDLYNPAWDQVS